MNCNTTHYRANSSSVPGDPTDGILACDDIDECAREQDDCDAAATCTNTLGGFACTCPEGYSGDGKSCEDVNECTAESDLCSSNASCANTTGAYTCTCNTGYTGDGFSCTPSEECRGSDVTNPNDGKDNDCDGKIDIPILRNTTFPAPNAATSAANVSIAITASTVAGATLQCRHFKRSSTPGAFATCTNPVTHPGTSTSAVNNGAWRTEVRWLFASGALSSTTSHDYYVHSTLHNVAKCTTAVSDATWFAKAAERLATPSAGTFIMSGATRDTFITLPFVRVTYDVPLAGTFNSDGDGILSVLQMDDALHTVEMLSLRKRFAVSSDRKYLLITRAYASTGAISGNGGNSCDVFNVKSHDSFYIGSTKDKQYLRYTCDAVVLSRSGAGVCLNASGSTAVFSKEYGDTIATRLLGYANANKFMWRELVQKRDKTKRMRNFTTKCYSAADCNVYGPNFPATYLPDRSVFP